MAGRTMYRLSVCRPLPARFANKRLQTVGIDSSKSFLFSLGQLPIFLCKLPGELPYVERPGLIELVQYLPLSLFFDVGLRRCGPTASLENASREHFTVLSLYPPKQSLDGPVSTLERFDAWMKSILEKIFRITRSAEL